MDRLKTVLKTYRHSATKSLHGPGRSPPSPPPPPPPPPDRESPVSPLSPVSFSQTSASSNSSKPLALSAPDRGGGERGETLLEGELISCFSVGGEKRLCLPQILTSVLTDFSLDQINRICDELQIYCSRCTPEQLHELKATAVLPKSAPSCGLITKTDAQRLCGALLHRGGRAPLQPLQPLQPVQTPTSEGALSFRVYHECFGKCRGVCSPRLGQACVECSECRRLFSPRRFVCHAHRRLENRTCHWGFDADRWRAYLLVAEDEPDRERLSAVLDALRSDEPLKHKQVVEPARKPEPSDVPPKKPKMEDFYSYMYAIDPYFHIQAATFYDQYRQLSAFRPPFLSREPPLLQHPEKVVRLKDSSRFERTFQPNVALKPQHPPTPPSSDEITSSTSPRAPPPDCELSTDTDEEDRKDAQECRPHLRKSRVAKEKGAAADGPPDPDPDPPSEPPEEDPRILELRADGEREKDALIAEQIETIREKDAIIARQIEKLREKEELILKQERILNEKRALILSQERTLREKETLILEQERIIKDKDAALSERIDVRSLENAQPDRIPPEATEAVESPGEPPERTVADETERGPEELSSESNAVRNENCGPVEEDASSDGPRRDREEDDAKDAKRQRE